MHIVSQALHSLLLITDGEPAERERGEEGEAGWGGGQARGQAVMVAWRRCSEGAAKRVGTAFKEDVTGCITSVCL